MNLTFQQQVALARYLRGDASLSELAESFGLSDAETLAQVQVGGWRKRDDANYDPAPVDGAPLDVRSGGLTFQQVEALAPTADAGSPRLIYLGEVSGPWR